MAMNTAASRDDEPILDMNTTPLIDVMLVLLVMLIITIPIQLHNVALNLPVGTPPPQAVKPEVVRIDIDAASVVYWNGVALSGREDWKAHMAEVAHQAIQPEIHVSPNRASRYDTFAAVMVAAHQAGLVKLGVVGAEQFAEGR